MRYIRFFSELTLQDISLVGGKNASLGEMIRYFTQAEIPIPDGFALTADAYWRHLEDNHLVDDIKKLLTDIQHDPRKRADNATLIRSLITEAPLPEDIKTELEHAYKKLSKIYHERSIFVAVRSSATAEDLPTAAFAGQQDSYLYIRGIESLIVAVKRCMASLFNERAIIYRAQKGFDDLSVALSVGIQKMVRADKGSAGVMFTLDTETGFRDVVIINAGYGLGELVVQGAITPQEYIVHKPTQAIIKKALGTQHAYLAYSNHTIKKRALTQKKQKNFALQDHLIKQLAAYGMRIEKLYSDRAGHWQPMDIEWAQDADGTLYIVQARAETIHTAPSLQMTYYTLQEHGKIITQGQSVGRHIISGVARVIKHIHEKKDFNKGDILITDMTDPDWLPLLTQAGGLVTNQGGRTCHAAIVSRELHIPTIIGTKYATQHIKDGDSITLDCSKGATGYVYAGKAKYTQEVITLEHKTHLPAKLMINIGDPDQAFMNAQLPVDGVGLARLEFIIASKIKVHPMAIAHAAQLPAPVQRKIRSLINGYHDPKDWYISTLAQSIAQIVAAFYPRPVIVRLTDFKSNEYRNLLGGKLFEPVEENPMLGFRGAARYMSERYAPAFELECAALKTVIAMGLSNMRLMVPFVRTVQEAQQTVQLLERHGLKRGINQLELYMMVEIPSNIILLQDFAQFFDGFSIGSNDLTQLTLGVDRDSGLLTQFDERDPAVMRFMQEAIEKAHMMRKPIGICGQAPSDFPEIADFLIKQGITSLSLNSDSVVQFLMKYAQKT